MYINVCVSVYLTLRLFRLLICLLDLLLPSVTHSHSRGSKGFPLFANHHILHLSPIHVFALITSLVFTEVRERQGKVYILKYSP